MSDLYQPKDEIQRVLCPSCNIEVPPTKRPSVAGVQILSGIYIIYYYLFVKRHCPLCFYKFSNDELKDYKDPDWIWKLLSVVLGILYIFGILFLIFGG